MKTLKNIITIMVLSIMIVSCGVTPCESYSLSEMETFIATGQATKTTDSLTIVDTYNNFETKKLPIVQLDKYGYYPDMSQGDGIRYYLAKPY